MIHRLLCLAAISVTTAPAFAQSVVSNRASKMATTAIENSAVPAPAIFAPGVISGPGNDGTPTFSPDGRTLYFYRYGTSPDSAVILESHHTAAGWSKPVAAPFSGPASDRQPALSPDGRTLVYASRRLLPAGPGKPLRPVTQLWRVIHTASGWSAPERLPDTVNISERMHNPSLAANGDLYFTCPTNQPGQELAWGLYRAAFRNRQYDRAQRLSFRGGDLLDADDPAIAPDQSYLIFGSHGLRAPLVQEHLFIAFRSGTSWEPPIQIHYEGDDWPDHNGNGDGEPQISTDGKTLYFDSSRSVPIASDRSRSQFLADVRRLNTWDNGNSNVWSLPLKPLLDAAGQRREEKQTDDKE
jgi:Tol biopolymer transport system component